MKLQYMQLTKISRKIVSIGKITLLYGGLFLIKYSFAQETDKKIEINFLGNINTEIISETEDGNLVEVRMDEKNGTLFYCKSIMDDSLIISTCDIEKQTHNNPIILISQGYKSKKINSIAVCQNQIFINLYHQTLSFTKSKNGLYNITGSQPHLFDEIVGCTDKNIIYGRNYNYYKINGISNDQRTGIGLFDINKVKMEKTKYFPFNHIVFTHLIKHYIDYHHKNFIVAQPIPYSILILDSLLEPKYEITLPDDLNYDPTELARVDSINNVNGRKVKDVIFNLNKIDKLISRIEKVYFLSDNKILVSKTIPGKHKEYRKIDIWEMVDNKWILTVHNQIYNTNMLEKNKANNQYKINVPLASSNQIIIYKNYLLTSSTEYIPIDIKKQESYKDFLKRSNEYFEENPVNNGIYIYKWDVTNE